MGRKPGIKNKTTKNLIVSSNDIDENKSDILENELPTDLKTKTETPIEIDKPLLKLSKKEKEKQAIAERLQKITEADIEGFKQVIDGIFNTIALRAGEKWKLSEMESDSIAKPATRIFVKYVGEFKYFDEMALCVVLFGIIASRLKTTEKKIDE